MFKNYTFYDGFLTRPKKYVLMRKKGGQKMEEYKEVVLVSSTDIRKLSNISLLLQDNNIPFLVEQGFCWRLTQSFVKKRIIVNSIDYNKAKKLIEENQEFISDKAKVVDPPSELQNIDEEYFNEIEKKIEKRGKNSRKIYRIIVLLYIAFIVGIIAIVLNKQ